MMRRIFLSLAAAIFMAVPAPAEEALPAEPAIEGTIRSQIDAFLADDFGTAFDFASPMIQGYFGTPERFGKMVREGYPMVWRPADMRFLELREIDGRLWQKVMVVDGEGRVHFLDYQMIEGPGGWRINGVQLLFAASVGV